MSKNEQDRLSKRLWPLRFMRACLTVAGSLWMLGAGAQGHLGAAPEPPPGVVVVLAGGGAKGFAHLAVLRQLERDRVPIARIVGTSMGAVIGSLYATGMRTEDIERVMASLDPTRVALDQVSRLELSPSERAYQQQYPVFEFGLKDGSLSFARGVSDGQRLLALLQRLFAHLPSDLDFNQLKIPLRIVATRYRDGQAQVFDRGPLHLAVRASTAAPGVFAPVEIGGEVYVDGALVANLPVDIALKEGAEQIVASYLGQTEAPPSADNALVVAQHMINLLLQQNERRNLALLRPQDILVRPELSDVGFADFHRAADVVARGEGALRAVTPEWQAMVQAHGGLRLPQAAEVILQPREVRIDDIRLSALRHVSPRFVRAHLADLQGQPFEPAEVARRLDRLYTSGHFEQVSYALEPLDEQRHVLVVQLQEKTYGPHYIRTALGFSTERDGVTQFSVGGSYRRPWLNAQGLVLQLGGRVGTLNEAEVRLIQPLGPAWTVELGAVKRSNILPYYLPDREGGSHWSKLAYFSDERDEVSASLTRAFGRTSLLTWSLLRATQRYDVDVTRSVQLDDGSLFTPQDARFRYSALRGQWDMDQLDSASFPTQGYALGVQLESGLSGATFQRIRARGQWAHSWGAHVLNLGGQLARDRYPRDCTGLCGHPTSLYLGGFQSMGAYRMGQLSGDQLVHASAAYMHRLSQGGLLQQKSFWGLMGEVGEAWYAGQPFRLRQSLTVFLALDSRIGEFYVGAARGSQGASNGFLQLGRRFQF